jgi:Zn-dependent M28 family amino/carboxypeptidase
LTAPLNTKARVVNQDGTASQWLIAYLQALGTGVVKRTTYTYATIATMTPSLGDTVICSDSSVTTIGTTLAGGGSNIVQAIGNGTAWKVI